MSGGLRPRGGRSRGCRTGCRGLRRGLHGTRRRRRLGLRLNRTRSRCAHGRTSFLIALGGWLGHSRRRARQAGAHRQGLTPLPKGRGATSNPEERGRLLVCEHGPISVRGESRTTRPDTKKIRDNPPLVPAKSLKLSKYKQRVTPRITEQISNPLNLRTYTILNCGLGYGCRGGSRGKRTPA